VCPHIPDNTISHHPLTLLPHTAGLQGGLGVAEVRAPPKAATAPRKQSKAAQLEPQDESKAAQQACCVAPARAHHVSHAAHRTTAPRIQRSSYSCHPPRPVTAVGATRRASSGAAAPPPPTPAPPPVGPRNLTAARQHTTKVPRKSASPQHHVSSQSPPPTPPLLQQPRQAPPQQQQDQQQQPQDQQQQDQLQRHQEGQQCAVHLSTLQPAGSWTASGVEASAQSSDSKVAAVGSVSKRIAQQQAQLQVWAAGQVQQARQTMEVGKPWCFRRQ
jgi:hypothetical protein